MKGIDKSRFQAFIVAPAKLLKSLQQDLEPGEAELLPLWISCIWDWQEMLRFFRFLRKNRIQIVNTHMFIATFYYAPIARLAGVPLVLETTHLMEKWRLGKGFFRRNSFLLDRVFYLLLDKVLAVSNSCKRDLIAMRGISADKIVVIQNGRDLEKFQPKINTQRGIELRKKYNYDTEDFIFGVLARLNHQKGHKYLLQAIKILQDRGVSIKVIFVGDGELKESLLAQCNALGIGDQIVFAGFQKDMPAYFAMIDVMVLPSLYEGLPLCAIEALAMERPAIATAVDGTPEIVIPDKTGILVAAKDGKVLAEAIVYALKNQETMRQLGRNGRTFVLEKFSLQRQVNETEALYDKLCFKKGILA
ncbi:MAG: glycosyltransferase family 4 protein [Proteobacteria bacterium]|nr:glycosyltransferase family 4 protein [Pseudomonadota bacterium]